MTNLLINTTNEFWKGMNNLGRVLNCSDNERIIMKEEFNYIDAYNVTGRIDVDWSKDELTLQTLGGNNKRSKIVRSLKDCEGFQDGKDMMIVTNIALYALANPDRFKSADTKKAYIYDELIRIRNLDADLGEKLSEATKLFPARTAICLSGNTRVAALKQHNYKYNNIKKYSLCFEKKMLERPENFGKNVKNLWEMALDGDIDALSLCFTYVIRQANSMSNTQRKALTAVFYKRFMDNYLVWHNKKETGEAPDGYIQSIDEVSSDISKIYSVPDMKEYSVLAEMILAKASTNSNISEKDLNQISKMFTVMTNTKGFSKNYPYINKILKSFGFDPKTLKIQDLSTVQYVWEKVSGTVEGRAVSYLLSEYPDIWKNNSDIKVIAELIRERYDSDPVSMKKKMSDNEEKLNHSFDLAKGGKLTSNDLYKLISFTCQSQGINFNELMGQIQECEGAM